jgi:hypothetical protein
MNRRNDSLFKLTKIEDFLPTVRKGDDGVIVSESRKTYKIIGSGDVTILQQQPQIFWIIQPSSNPSVRYAVAVPETMNQKGSSITFMERGKNGEERIRINQKRKRKSKTPFCIYLYEHPTLGVRLRWSKCLLYKKIGKTWTLIESDGRPV